MSSKCGRRDEPSDVLEIEEEATTLVVGSTNHDTPCRRLAGATTGRGYHLRLAVNEPDSVPAANTDDRYEAGVFDDLSLASAGIAASDAIANLDRDGETLDSGQLVVCVDGLPLPSTEADRNRLFQFLHAITCRVRAADGHCHAHLAVGPESRIATVVEPLFEYVVETTND